MSQLQLSQLPPLPEIKRIKLGKTIGHGGFGIVKIGETDSKFPNVAVKLLFLRQAKQLGVSVEDIAREAYIQKRSKHKNIITLYDFNYNADWAWIALELAESGELFDKIEPDLGVDLDVAHFYFKQLVNAVEFLHSNGVAHRDIKPENLVLDSRGNLKLTDFGLAVVFKKSSGPKKRCTVPCGSPPYAAPEVVSRDYDPSMSDVWSCGVVLFVLLTGKIAWEMPVMEDPDYSYYIKHKGEVLVSPWNKIDLGALSLLRKILVPDVNERITIDKLKNHTWVQRKTGLMDADGMCKDPKKLSAKLLVNLYINLSDEEFRKVTEYSTQRSSKKKLDTQPIVQGIIDDMNDSTGYLYTGNYSSTQQPYTERTKRKKLRASADTRHQRELEMIAMDPSIIQFYGHNNNIDSVKMEKKLEKIRKFPALYGETMNRFLSLADLDYILSLITEALVQLGIMNHDKDLETQTITQQIKENQRYNGVVRYQIDYVDDYKNRLAGEIVVSKVADNLEVTKIEFSRRIGDPLEWRRLFKRVTILCRDIVYYPQ